MSYAYAPGCALTDYKPHLAEKVHAFLCEYLGDMPLYDGCCRVPHTLAEGTIVINTCPGCNRRFQEEQEGISTVSLWEVLADCDAFPFQITAACPSPSTTPAPRAASPGCTRPSARCLQK
ncbi:MAG TPA: hypothetical protein PKU80_11890 [Candidatus Limiplasma sp.]|nr:hypothetical protein [Candidatus Limiplasma sp.]